MVIPKSLVICAEMATHHEGLSLDPYHDPVGYPTIGYGHLLSRERYADLAQWEPLPDEAAARDLLMRDMMHALAAVRRLCPVPLSDEQEAALVDFAFNCGAGNLQCSTLRRVVNREEHEDAPPQYKRWVYANKIKLNGLVARRRDEANLHELGTDE